MRGREWELPVRARERWKWEEGLKKRKGNEIVLNYHHTNFYGDVKVHAHSSSSSSRSERRKERGGVGRNKSTFFCWNCRKCIGKLSSESDLKSLLFKQVSSSGRERERW
jgi:hypothetical protein